MATHDYPAFENKLGITDGQELTKVLTELVAPSYEKLLNTPQSGAFDKAHLCAIHKELFQDAYDWAGTTRTPGQEVSAMGHIMCRSAYVDNELNRVFKGISQEQPTSPKEALHSVAQWWGEMTMVHPFHDGNSRSQAIFFKYLAHHWGANINMSTVSAAELHAARYIGAFKMDSRYLEKALSRGVKGCEPPNNEREQNLIKGKTSVELYEAMEKERP